MFVEYPAVDLYDELEGRWSGEGKKEGNEICVMNEAWEQALSRLRNSRLG